MHIKFVWPLFFLLLISTVKCSDSDIVELNSRERKFTKLDREKTLQSFKKSKLLLNSNKRVQSSIHDRIDWGRIYKVINNDTHITTYTIPLRIIETSSFENFIIVERENTQYAYIIRYTPDKDWVQSKAMRGGFESYTGILEVLNLKGEVESSTKFINGLPIYNSNGRVSCETLIDVEWTVVCVENSCNITEITWTEYEVCPTTGSGPVTGGGNGSEEEGGPKGGVGPTPNGGGDPGLWEPCANGEYLDGDVDCVEGSAENEPGFKICNRYVSFDALPNNDGETSYTGQVNRVHAPAVHRETGEYVEAFWGAWCVTYGSSAYHVNDSFSASSIFKEAWYLTTVEAEAWLNAQPVNPGNVVFAKTFLIIFEENLSLMAGGYTNVTTGGCLGEVSTTWLRYCR